MGKLNNKGQTLVEYILIISLVAVLAVGLVNYFGGYLKDAVTKMSCSIASKEYVEGKKVGEAHCEGEEENILE